MDDVGPNSYKLSFQKAKPGLTYGLTATLRFKTAGTFFSVKNLKIARREKSSKRALFIIKTTFFIFP